MNPFSKRSQMSLASLGVVSAFSAVLFALSPREAGAQANVAGWHTSLTRAAEIAAESKKPIFAVFRCVR